jgi:hypothetical protein
MTSLAVYAVYVTPTDVQGWMSASVPALAILLGALLAAAVVENTVRGKRLVDAAIRRIERTR